MVVNDAFIKFTIALFSQAVDCSSLCWDFFQSILLSYSFLLDSRTKLVVGTVAAVEQKRIGLFIFDLRKTNIVGFSHRRTSFEKTFLYSTNEKMPFPNGVAVWVERNTARKKSFCLQKFGAAAFFGLLVPTEFAGFGKSGRGCVARPRQTILQKPFSYLYSK